MPTYSEATDIARAMLEDLTDPVWPLPNYERAQMLSAFYAIPAGELKALLAQCDAEEQAARDHLNLVARRATVAKRLACEVTGLGA